MQRAEIGRKSRFSSNLDDRKGEWRKIKLSPEKELKINKNEKALHSQFIIPLQQLMQSKVDCSAADKLKLQCGTDDAVRFLPSFSIDRSPVADIYTIPNYKDFSPGEVKDQQENIKKENDNHEDVTKKNNQQEDVIKKSSQLEDVIKTYVKGSIILKHCVLIPPDPKDNILSEEKKYIGCDTIFVSCLPPKCDKEIIHEIFKHYGRIYRVKMTKGNHCFITFRHSRSVNKAIKLSGYKLVINHKDDSAHAGRLYITQRQNKLEPCASIQSPYEIRYSSLHAGYLTDKLKSENNFLEAIPVLVTWLKQGECTKNRADTFINLLKTTVTHIKRLTNDALQLKKLYSIAEMPLKQNINRITLQLEDICKICEIANSSRVLKNFSKRQRKKIVAWKHLTLEIKKAHFQELIEERVEEEMDLSDQEHDSVRDHSTVKRKLEENINFKEQLCKAEKLFNDSFNNYGNVYDTSSNTSSDINYGQQSNDSISVTSNEMCLVIRISTFLIHHPNGASINEISQFLTKDKALINLTAVENLLLKYSYLFEEQYSLNKSVLLRKWVFLGFTFKSV